MARFSSERPDNCNVSINAFAHRAVALTETGLPVCFDPETLEALGHYGISDEIGGTVSTAHPHHDADRKRQFSYVIDFDAPAATACSPSMTTAAPSARSPSCRSTGPPTCTASG
jgi:carotenoid cleavage dioxygenase-like enzyme